MSKELEETLERISKALDGYYNRFSNSQSAFDEDVQAVKQALTPSVGQEEILELINDIDKLEIINKYHINKLRQYIMQPKQSLTTDHTLEIVKEIKKQIETEIYKFESIFGKERLWGITLAKNDLKLLEKIISESEGTK